MDHIITLPHTLANLNPRAIELNPSLIHQIDGAIFTLFGVRIEHDFMASSRTDAYCECYGRRPNASMASATGLYLHDPCQMAGIVAAAISQRACGVFILPAQAERHTRIKRSATTTPEPLGALLQAASLLTIQLPVDGIRHSLVLNKSTLHQRYVAIFARFGSAPKFKTTVRIERTRKTLTLRCTPFKQRYLGARPALYHRVCEFADEKSPSPEDDRATSSPPFPAQPCIALPAAREPKWDAALWAQLTIGYPCPRTRDLALSVMRNDFDPFVGDRTKAVDQPHRNLDPEVATYLRGKMIAETTKLYNVGPFSAVPYPNARITPVGAKIKDKYDPACREWRVTHDFSAGAPSSINNLYWNPQWLTVHFSVSMLMDQLACLGPGTRVTVRDVPAAFKMNSNPIATLHLHVSRISTTEHGTEYFIELANEFGNLVSEYGWQGELAMILFVLDKRCSQHIDFFVDNSFEYHPPSSLKGQAQTEAHATDKCFDDLGIKRHQQISACTKFYGLGWDFDLASNHPEWPMVIICPAAKRTYYNVKLPEWAAMPRLDLNTIEQACGAMRWLATAFKAGVPYIAPMYALLASALAINAKRSGQSIPPGKAAKAALDFWAVFFLKWDGVCPIMASFGPNTGPQIIGTVDASGKACGGTMHCTTPDGRHTTRYAFHHAFTEAELANANSIEGVTSSGYLEMLGVIWWLRFFAKRCRAKRVLLETDATAVEGAMLKAHSNTPRMHQAVCEARTHTAEQYIDLRITQVKGKCFNIIADSISRDQPSKAVRQARKLYGAELIMIDRPLTR
jgi:hypothetical protein